MRRARRVRVPLVVLAIAAVMGCASRITQTAPRVRPEGVQFSLLRPDAGSVALAGDFNGWSAASHPLERTTGGRWEIVMPLSPGEHLFMYVIDGSEWVSPPAAEGYKDDGFGAQNGVVIVRPDEG